MIRPPDIEFSVESVRVEPYAVSPQLNFALRLALPEREAEVENIILQSQTRIAASRRQYTPAEQEHLSDLFGTPERWGRSVQSLLWAHSCLAVQRFVGGCLVQLPVVCSFDFNIAATKYFHGLESGEVPLEFLFSGSIFYRNDEGALQSGQIPWSKESHFRLPVRVWRELMDTYYPDSAWLRLSSAAFEMLYRFKREQGLTGWEEVIERLLAADPMAVRSRAELNA